MKRKIVMLVFLVFAVYFVPAQASFRSSRPSCALTNTVEKALPAVVFVAKEINYFDLSYGSDPDSFYEYFRPFYEWLWPPRIGHGSGFIVSPDGYVVTNAHVAKDATSLLVVMQNPEYRVLKASVIGSDPRTDIAVLKIENEDQMEFPYLEFGNSHHAKVGEQIIAIGSPLFSELESTVTMGIISAKDRNHCGDEIEGYIQTDAAINYGNSGGPILDIKGNVIGITSWTLNYSCAGLGFAIPSSTAQLIAAQLIANGKVSQGFLGVEVENEREDVFDAYFFDPNVGASVKKVVKDSPAEGAGLEENDLVIEVNGQCVRSPQDLRNYICVLTPETKVDLKINREGEILQISLELGSEELSKKHSTLPLLGTKLLF